jgi:hypothetical protein
MNSHLRVLVLCFWLFFLAFRQFLCCCVHNLDATVTPPSLARAAHDLLSPERHTPSRHTTFARLRRYLRRKSRRDKPSRHGFLRDVARQPHHHSSAFGHTTAFGHPWALGSTHPDPQPRKQYRTSFPNPPLWETPHSPQPPLLAPGPTTTSDGAACLVVTPPPPTAPAVPHLLRSTSTTDEN